MDKLLYDYGPYVRVVVRPCDRPAGLLVVQARMTDGLRWVDMRTIDGISDDLSYSNALDYAEQLVKKMQVFDELRGPIEIDDDTFARSYEAARRIADAKEGFDDL